MRSLNIEVKVYIIYLCSDLLRINYQLILVQKNRDDKIRLIIIRYHLMDVFIHDIKYYTKKFRALGFCYPFDNLYQIKNPKQLLVCFWNR